MSLHGSSPPKTPLALHVGVTGHRVLSQEASKAVAQSLALVLHHIHEIAAGILHQHPCLFAQEPPSLRCISSLAEGADQLMAQEALAQGYQLHAPLPFHREEYAKDFQSAEALAGLNTLLAQADRIFEADGDPAERDEAYLQAGLLVLEHSDLLVAVWDASQTPRSMVGTARIVAEAKQHHIPVVVIDPAQNGRIFMEWRQSNDPWQDTLTRTMQAILCPSKLRADGQGSSPHSYFQEQCPRHNFRGCLAVPFENLLAGKISSPGWTMSPPCPPLREEWSHLGQSVLGTLSPQMGRVEDILNQHFHWADQLSRYYSSRYRSLAILRYLTLGLLLIGLLLGFYSNTFNAWGFSLQVLGFGVLLFLSRENIREECHQKFLDYRYLAEHLRHLRVLALMGRTMTAARIPAFNKDAASAWVNWHFRNIVRSIGLVSCRVDNGYLAAFKKLFVDGLLLEQKNCQGQVAFYADRRMRYQTIAGRLDFLGRLFFWLGLTAICIRAAVFWVAPPPANVPPDSHWKAVKDWCNILSLALPALAPIFFGLKAQGEYDRIARRYQAMEQELRRRIERFTQDATVNSTGLGQFAKDTAERLVDEVSDWRILVRTKNIKPY